MKKTLILLATVLLTNFAIAQQGFNYKALITDNGNVLANTSVNVQFTILESGTTMVYKETHTATTDANGILIVNIGEGNATSGNFATLDWTNEYFLKVEIDTGSGYQDFGTTAFKAVPYAKSAEKLLPTDKVIIGDTDTYSSEKLYVKNANPGSELVDFRVGDLTAGKDVLNLYIDQNTSGSGSNNRSQFIEASKGSAVMFKVDDNGRVFSQKGYYTNGYVEAVGDITSYSNIKSWGNLEVDGEVTSNLNMGDNRNLHMDDSNRIVGNYSSWDMKAYAYGVFDRNGNIDRGSGGYTVEHIEYGVYHVIFDNTSYGSYGIIIATAEHFHAVNNYNDILPVFVQTGYGNSTYNNSFNIFTFDSNGNLTENDSMRIHFVFYRH